MTSIGEVGEGVRFRLAALDQLGFFPQSGTTRHQCLQACPLVTVAAASRGHEGEQASCKDGTLHEVRTQPAPVSCSWNVEAERRRRSRVRVKKENHIVRQPATTENKYPRNPIVQTVRKEQQQQ